MARKRMFDSEIISQDRFIDLSLEAKALYFLLGMEADDEGFLSPKKILRIHDGTDAMLEELIRSNFIIRFDSGVILITDWNRNNYLDHSRIKETIYLDEKKKIIYDAQKCKYMCLTDFKQMLNQNSIEENNIEKNRKEEDSVYILSPKDVIYKDIIDYLNLKLDTNYKWDNPNTKELIDRRLNEGFNKEDFKTVIDKKYVEWNGTKYEKYLVPTTLFGDKFESYLNQKNNKSIWDMSDEEMDDYFKSINN